MPESRPPIIVAPDLETPGIKANIWYSPTITACFLGITSNLLPDLGGFGALFKHSISQIAIPPAIKANPTVVATAYVDSWSFSKNPAKPAGIVAITQFNINLTATGSCLNSPAILEIKSFR